MTVQILGTDWTRENKVGLHCAGQSIHLPLLFLQLIILSSSYFHPTNKGAQKIQLITVDGLYGILGKEGWCDKQGKKKKEKEWMGPQKSLLVCLIQLVLYLRPQLAGVGDALGDVCKERERYMNEHYCGPTNATWQAMPILTQVLLIVLT